MRACARSRHFFLLPLSLSLSPGEKQATIIVFAWILFFDSLAHTHTPKKHPELQNKTQSIQSSSSSRLAESSSFLLSSLLLLLHQSIG